MRYQVIISDTRYLDCLSGMKVGPIYSSSKFNEALPAFNAYKDLSRDKNSGFYGATVTLYDHAEILFQSNRSTK